jgi:hypothetical protein
MLTLTWTFIRANMPPGGVKDDSMKLPDGVGETGRKFMQEKGMSALPYAVERQETRFS